MMMMMMMSMMKIWKRKIGVTVQYSIVHNEEEKAG